LVSNAFDRSRSSWNETSASLIRLKRSPAGLRAPLWPLAGAGLSEAEPEPVKALPRAFLRSGWTLASSAAASAAAVETSSDALRLVEVTVVWTMVVVVEVVATGAADRT
jgi:hypothetical protein